MGVSDIRTLENIPAAQALLFTIQRAIETLVWLKESNKEYKAAIASKKDASRLATRCRILADVISVYVTTLVDGGSRRGHSLLGSYAPHHFTEEFSKLEIVRKCKLNRNKRSAHEDKSYGFFVNPKEILESPLEAWLKDAILFLMVIPEENTTTKLFSDFPNPHE